MGNNQSKANESCTVCDNHNQSVPSTLEHFEKHPIAEAIMHAHPEWNPEDGVCINCLDHYHQEVLSKLINVNRKEGFTVLPTPIRLNTCLLYTSPSPRD